jgi:acyl-CoA reductase-like NAD-dependent aldehyde dehydrogenase
MRKHYIFKAEVPRAIEQDVDIAVNVAAKAFETWRYMQARNCGKLLSKIAEAIIHLSKTIYEAILTSR